jgi:hypothetical protein
LEYSVDSFRPKASGSKPNENPACLPVYITHHGDLVILLVCVALVDANLVNPEEAIIDVVEDMDQRLCEGLGDR